METISDFLVIIPTYKRQDALRAAIRSAVNQRGVTKRIVVADDCPDGSAADVVRKFPEVIYLKNPEPSGGWPGRVRNFALEACRGTGIKARHVHFLDDDDTVPEGHYAVAKETFEQHPNIGVVFGILRPFCMFSSDPERRRRQELQLRDVRDARCRAGRFPWLCQQIDTSLRLPAVAQWLYRQYAIFGPEMFLCSGGVIRHEHVLELGGFPDFRITQDYCFYSDAIRKFGAVFLRRETAGYGVGNSNAVWNPLDLSGAAMVAHTNEWTQELAVRHRNVVAEIGYFKYLWLKITFRVEIAIFDRILVPVLDRWSYFEDLYRITDSDRIARDCRWLSESARIRRKGYHGPK